MSTHRFDTAAHAYDRFMGRWSRLFLPAVVESARVRPGHRVLDLAAGTGEATRAAIAAVADVDVVAVDMSAPMLRTARTKLAGERVTFAVMDGQALACGAESVDAALCMLGLMFFPDPVRGASELHRVLRRGGRAAVCVWSSQERAPYPGIILDVLARHAPHQHDELLASFALADADRLRGVLTAGGFTEVEVTPVVRRFVFEGFDDFWAPLASGGARASQMLLALPKGTRDAVHEGVRARVGSLERDGRIVMDVETLIGVGVRG